MSNQPRRLGRGLAALLGAADDAAARSQPARGLAADADAELDAVLQQEADLGSASDHLRPAGDAPPRAAGGPASVGGASAAGEPAGGELRLNVNEIDDNPFQPRREFSEAEIASLSESLREHDMLQPVLVRRVGGRYQLISGERRLRAAVRAGWTTVPARLREADDRLVAELAIVENLQRKDLNAIEKALAFQRYLEQHRCTQDELARRLKLDRSTIANLVRLLELPPVVQDAVRTGAISAGHARALLPLGDEAAQTSFCLRIREEELSVREVERQVGERIRREDGPQLSVVTPPKSAPKKAGQVAALEQELKLALGCKVDIRQAGRGRGKIVLHFGSHAEFERLHALLTGEDVDDDARAVS